MGMKFSGLKKVLLPEKKAVKTTPPSMVGRKVYLKPATADDIEKSYHWVMMAEPGKHAVQDGPILSASDAAEEFKKLRQGEDRQTFMIVRVSDDTPVGIIRYEDLNPLTRAADVSLNMDPEEKDKGFSDEGMWLLLNQLFHHRNLNKVTARATELEEDWKKLLEKSRFTQVGTLPQQHYYNNALYDVHLYSILHFDFGE